MSRILNRPLSYIRKTPLRAKLLWHFYVSAQNVVHKRTKHSRCLDTPGESLLQCHPSLGLFFLRPRVHCKAKKNNDRIGYSVLPSNTYVWFTAEAFEGQWKTVSLPCELCIQRNRFSFVPCCISLIEREWASERVSVVVCFFCLYRVLQHVWGSTVCDLSLLWLPVLCNQVVPDPP